MSEYQYYEFQALDRILTKTEQSYIESLSSRVELSPTKAAFTYSYGADGMTKMVKMQTK
jgi:hypothetical protein